MASIAVFHPDLASKGGGEAVCMNVLQALQDGHDLTLVTVTEPDFDDLNEYYNTEVRPPELDRAGRVGWTLDALATRLGIPETRVWKLRSALLKRFWDSSPYDLVFSTYNEFTFEKPAIQYLHYPNAAGPRQRVPEWAYLRLVELLDGYDQETIRSSRLLANSEWTASVADDYYGVRPQTIYPPVDTTGFDPIPWSERESGFVTVGRIEPTKNVLRNIEIIQKIRERGHDVHLHVVGPRADSDYSREVVRKAECLSYVSLEGELTRSELLEFITTHRYGLHGKVSEHFGMAVAELLAAGALPFAPDSGGQREVLNQRNELLYRSTDDAIAKICTLIDNPKRALAIREQLPDIEARFGRRQFRSKIVDVVTDVLNP